MESVNFTNSSLSLAALALFLPFVFASIYLRFRDGDNLLHRFKEARRVGLGFHELIFVIVARFVSDFSLYFPGWKLAFVYHGFNFITGNRYSKSEMTSDVENIGIFDFSNEINSDRIVSQLRYLLIAKFSLKSCLRVLCTSGGNISRKFFVISRYVQSKIGGMSSQDYSPADNYVMGRGLSVINNRKVHLRGLSACSGKANGTRGSVYMQISSELPLFRILSNARLLVIDFIGLELENCQNHINAEGCHDC